MNTIDFQILDASTLSAATGGKAASPGGGGTPPHKDFASRYVDNLKQDGKDWANREIGGAEQLQQHHYLKAAGNYGGALLDEVGALGDAIAPVKALW